MDGWWKRDPFFVKYMAREATAFFVVVYAAILLVTLVRLAEGEASFDRWMATLRSPASILLHMMLLGVFLYHTLSWFQIMPKTMAPVVVGGRKVPACAITAAGLAASVVASAVLFFLLLGVSP
jgi:fumarate reductase subunit C